MTRRPTGATLTDLVALGGATDELALERGPVIGLRALTGPQITRIIALEGRQTNGEADGAWLDQQLTVAFGLASPDLQADTDLEAALAAVATLPPWLVRELAERITALTWQPTSGMFTPVAPSRPVPEPAIGILSSLKEWLPDA